jgi:osmoprotectant transport system permease protein
VSLVSSDSGSAPNPWFSWTYVSQHGDLLRTALDDHVFLTLVPVLLAFLIAFPLALVARRWRLLQGPILVSSGAIYTIPSLALFGFLWPTFGLSRKTVIIALTVYAVLIILRNLIVGLDGVPEDVRDAARGMGFGGTRMLWRVELPLAIPTIMAGVRIATVSTIGLVTIGAVFGHGGFGDLILDGFQNNFFHAEIMTGVIACVLLAVVAETLLLLLERVLTPWARKGVR